MALLIGAIPTSHHVHLGEPAWELSAAGKERLGYVPQKTCRVTIVLGSTLTGYDFSFF